MSGYVAMQRGWHENEIFGNDEFSRRDAWSWLVANAAWKPTKVRIKGTSIDLDRGQMSFSVRFLAEKWRWSKSRVDRFIAELRREGMISTRSKIGTTAGHPAGQGQSILSICNYAKYQDRAERQRDSAEAQIGTTAGQQRDKEEPRNQETIEPEEQGGGGKPPAADYAFFGRTIRLKPSDLEKWRKVYHAVPDLEAELTSLDAWFEGQAPTKRKSWFHTTAGALNRKHQEILAKAKAEALEPIWDGFA